MLKPLSIVVLALAALPAVAGAQPLDPYGRPYVMSPPQPSPGDPQMSQRMPAPPVQGQGAPMYNAAPSQAMAPADAGGITRDEYGNMYNSRGDRIDRSGRILPPPLTPPGARALK